MRNEIMQRLSRQRRSAQIKLLQQYGKAWEANAIEANADAKASVVGLKGFKEVAHVDARGSTEKPDMVALSTECSASALCPSQKSSAPQCVCGSSLQLIGGLQRLRYFPGADKLS